VNPNKKNIEIIKQFNLSPHPEGGWFREIVRSDNSLIREDGQSRNFITGIYYLLERNAKSAWHRVKNADDIWIYLRGDPLNLWCLDNDNKLIRNLILNNNNDSVIAAGGGKVLDSGKYIAECLNIPCITVPLSASTCAGWTALSNIYTKDGQFIKDVALRSCPKILVFDHKFIQTAPSRTLASGIADALAKWYESSITSSKIDDGLVQQAIQISRVLRDQLLIDGGKAFKGQFENNPSWQNTVEACGLTAGLVGGIGGEKCRTAAAHAIHNAITQIISPNKFLHGEIVGVGLLLQLRLEEMKNNNKLADQSIKQLFLDAGYDVSKIERE